ncbi:MAG: hypothetical protein AAFP19_07745 [Bacteroidota bacterium]
MRRILPFLLFIALFQTACKEKTFVYEVNDLEVSTNNGDKTKEKTPEQFITIAYTNIFQQALSTSEQVDIANLIRSIGDKQVAFETVIARLMTDPDINIPSAAEMHDNPEQFIRDTYRRFFVREPSQAEQTYFVNYIESHPDLDPALVYYSFATSNEYYFY